MKRLDIMKRYEVMKRFSILFAIFLLQLVNLKVNGQGFFNQKGAWIKNQLKQIALFEIYIKDVEKGYAIAKDRLNIIGNIKDGDFHLHLNHFNALTAVNPEIKKYSKAFQIVLLQSYVKRLWIKSDDEYINSVWSHLIDGCQNDVDQLNTLLTPGNFQMTDDERIKNIDKLYVSIKDKYSFAKYFSNDVKILSLHQLKEKNEIKTSRLLNNIKIPD